MAQPAHRQSYDPTTAYAVDVVDGRVVVGKPVLWACQRHLEDLEHGHLRGLWWDPEAAQDFLDFSRLCHHFEGELAGQPFSPEPWQEFSLGSVFGWKKDDGYRRFREAYNRISRKMGKSFKGAIVGNYGLVADGEEGAQIYTAATKREQARIIHRAAIAVRDSSPSLRRVVKKLRDRLVVDETRSFFAPLGKDSDTEDGLNPHMAILDEIHAHKDSGMWDVLESGMGARKQPLIFAVTTAGYGVNTFGRQQDDYYRSVIEPGSGVDNDAAFVFIAELERKATCGACRGKGCKACDGRGYRGDDPYDEAVWPKCCPNLGVSVSIDYMRQRALKAKQHPPSEAEFLAKNTNQWVDTEDRWITTEQWDAAGKRGGAADLKPEGLKGRPCFAGLDLATTTDTCAFLRYFPPTAQHPIPAVLADFWVPADRIAERWKKDRVDYRSWVDAGYIRAVPGSSIDQTVLYADLCELAKEHPIQLLKYDPRDAQMLATLLEGAGWRLEKAGQGYAEYNAPTRELEAIVFDRPLAHFGNPVLRWMVANVVLARNIDGDVMPAKGKSPEKIDGAAALIMAIGAAGTHPVTVGLPPVHHVVRPPGSQQRGGPGRGGGSRQIFRAFK